MSGTHVVGGDFDDNLGASSSNGASLGGTLVPSVVNLDNSASPSSTRVLSNMGHSEWKKLPHGPLECEDLMKEMLDIVVVDGSSSCIPGEVFGGGTGRGVGEGIYEMDGETNT
ncbi:hypothetical protein GUJ93_ZPchr0012g22094 [Zizania palustris]|uniref:Uncharacterized protein n=1 Tax=Zizania palustris TaxID=103762 RepID=A0A8J6BZ09_ZIZPA|nr:hypothetical protein GUJ93_ZPchr0012g22094 [Zizania palustris]